MTDNDKEWTVEFSDQVKAQMERDPKLAEILREFVAAFHQANDGVERGQYQNHKEGVESILGGTITELNPDELPDEVREELAKTIVKHEAKKGKH